jgi:hypothetical protein
MQKLILLFLVLLSFNAAAAQADNTKSQPVNDHVIIKRHKIVIVRDRELAKLFPGRQRAVITYPVVSGLSNPAVLRRVRSVLDFKNIFDSSLKDYREDGWLTDFTYVVNYNKNYLLDITFTQSGMAAYPDEQSKHFIINLREGRILKAQDVFESNRLDSLAATVDRELQREIKQIANENKEPDEKETVDGAYDNLKFELKDLDEFSVGPKGITFLYDAGFPHVIKALEPEGRYFFSYSHLKPYIKRDSPLWQFIE